MLNLSRFLSLSVVLALAASNAEAQWIKLTTPDIPRTAAGQPDLKAPTPRQAGTPDLTGLWALTAVGYTNNVVTDLKPEEIDPVAAALYRERQENLFVDDPATFRCLPPGARAFYAPMQWVRIIQTPSMITMLYEDLVYRQVFMDGRDLPKDPNPSFMGYSVGRWEGNTLIIDSSGFNDTTWLDYGGHPHSESLKVRERITRTDLGHLSVEVMFEDPKYYKRAWTVPAMAQLIVDTEMIEYVCNENQKDIPHLVGKASDDRKLAVSLPPDILARHVGTYAFDPTHTMKIHITLSDGVLYMDVGGKDRKEMIPMSESNFVVSGVRTEFGADYIIFHNFEGDAKAMRQKE